MNLNLKSQLESDLLFLVLLLFGSLQSCHIDRVGYLKAVVSHENSGAKMFTYKVLFEQSSTEEPVAARIRRILLSTPAAEAVKQVGETLDVIVKGGKLYMTDTDLPDAKANALSFENFERIRKVLPSVYTEMQMLCNPIPVVRSKVSDTILTSFYLDCLSINT